MKEKYSTKLDQCTVCKSKNTVEWYPENIDLNNISFTYEFSSQSQKTFRVVRCKECTHVFCSPLPKNMYKNYEDVVDKQYLFHKKTRLLTARVVLKFIQRYISKGRLLDVGCATGDFLTVAKKFGYSVEGLELSEWSCKITRSKGIPVYRTRLTTLSRRFTQSFDIITLWGVIEHFECPLEEMAHIYCLLKPGGFLVIWTGDVDGLMSRFLGRRWWYWQGQHIQYFTHASLNYIGAISGFKHITTKLYPLAATFKQIDNSLSRYKFKSYVLWFIKLLFRVKSIWHLQLPGEMLWIACKRTKK